MSENGNVAQIENSFLDLHGRQVHAFSIEMANVGFTRMADLLKSMLDSEAWRSYKDGQGEHNFLPGEFDYFLTQRGIRREDVYERPGHGMQRGASRSTWMSGALARTATAARTPGPRGEPHGAGKAHRAVGLTQNRGKALVNEGGAIGGLWHREALGHRARRYAETGDAKAKSEKNPRSSFERVRSAALRLGDDDLADLINSLKQERRRRQRTT